MKHAPMVVLMFLVLVVTFSSSSTVVLGQQMNMNQMNQSMQNQSAINTNQGMSGMSNMKNMIMSHITYDIMVGGQSFKVMVGSNGDLPKSVQFNQDQKSISFDASGLTTKDFSHYDITISDVLLSGNFTATIDGKSIKTITVPNEASATVHIIIPSSYVKGNSIGDSATITFAGTTAIPEFPLGPSIGLISAFAIVAVMISRSKFNIRK